MKQKATRNPAYGTNSNIPPFDITQLIIHKADIQADKIKVRNINADNFSANLTLDKEGTANAKNFKFDIAEGSVNGNFKT